MNRPPYPAFRLQFRAVCSLHPCAVAIHIRLPRSVEISTAQIDILEKFYRTQRLSQYVHEKTLLFLGDGKHIEYDPERHDQREEGDS